MTSAFVSSDLLFLDTAEGKYELEGRFDDLKLPQNLSESIRLRTVLGVRSHSIPRAPGSGFDCR